MAVRKYLSCFALVACAWSMPANAQADSTAELDALVAASSDPVSGIALARTQIGGGELTGALATLERVLMRNPESDDALLLHASLLCRLDDPAGARAEIAEIGAIPVRDRSWAEVTAACGPVPRPGGRRGK
jgi:Flp pilus assembly protein TadD